MQGCPGVTRHGARHPYSNKMNNLTAQRSRWSIESPIASLSSLRRSPVLQTFGTSAGLTLVGLLNSVLLARWLGLTGRGELAAALLWPPFAGSVMGLGFYTAITYFTARRDVDTRVVLGSALACGAVQATVGVIAGYFLLPLLLYKQSAFVVACARLYLAIIPISIVSQYLQSVLQGKLRFGVLNGLRAIVPVGYFVGSISLAVTNRLQIPAIVTLHIGLQLLTLVLALAATQKIGCLAGLSVDASIVKRLVGYGGRVYAGEMTGNVNTRLDQMLMAALFPPKLLGLYVVAVAAAGGPEMLANAVRLVSSPRIAGCGSQTERRVQLVRTFRRYVMAVVPFAVLLALALPLLIPVLYGSEFRGAILTTEVLLLAGVVIGGAIVLGAGGQAMGDPWVNSKAQICAIPVTVTSLLLLMPRIGVIGAGLASLAAYSAQLGVVYLGLEKHGICLTDLVARYRASVPVRAVTNSET